MPRAIVVVNTDHLGDLSKQVLRERATFYAVEDTGGVWSLNRGRRDLTSGTCLNTVTVLDALRGHTNGPDWNPFKAMDDVLLDVTDLLQPGTVLYEKIFDSPEFAAAIGDTNAYDWELADFEVMRVEFEWTAGPARRRSYLLHGHYHAGGTQEEDKMHAGTKVRGEFTLRLAEDGSAILEGHRAAVDYGEEADDEPDPSEPED
jgi:hypothetical protein